MPGPAGDQRRRLAGQLGPASAVDDRDNRGVGAKGVARVGSAAQGGQRREQRGRADAFGRRARAHDVRYRVLELLQS